MKAIHALVLVVAMSVSACSSEQAGAPGGPGAPGPIEVGYVVLERTSVPRSADLAGRVVPYATAEVRPQVDGIVREIAFRETRQVEADDILYRLDDRKFQAALAAAKAVVKRTEAATVAAQLAHDRAEQLAASNSVSQSALDDARSTLLQAQADEDAAKADLDAAQINLDNATIRAPIDGIVGVSTVSVGALVTANQSAALVTIRQLDPIYVDLVDSSANLLRIRDLVEAGLLGRSQEAAPAVTLTLENGREYDRAGELKLADIVISETTGTFSIRATFPNPDTVLLPGMFVRAKIDLGATPNAFLIPQRAVSRSSTGEATVYIVSGEGKAALRTITTIGSVGNDWIVVDGVADGDRLIVDGFQKISDGAEVIPVEATIDADGVVRQTLAPATGTAAADATGPAAGTQP